jgi:SAM-dependent methyltransferase
LGVPVANGGLAVDIGCGTGGALVVLSAEFDHVIGVDISMSNLALAKKRLEEHDVLNVTLLAGCAESLPLPDESASYVNASDVIEHVQDQEGFMREAYRLLDEEGCFRLSTPNRYILGREGHVNLFGVGFLPRAWQSRFVQIMRGIPYEHIRPLSYRELVCLCRAAAGDKHRALTETEVIRHASIPAGSTRGLLRRAVISSRVGAWVVSTLERRFGRFYEALLWR